MLKRRADEPQIGTLGVVFSSTAGTLRDPNNFELWRPVRDELGVSDTRTHSFRKTVATLIDDEGLSARIGAGHLGHQHVSMTQDRYMTRGRQHSEVAALLDRAINDGCLISRLRKQAMTWGGRGSNPRPTDYESAALTD